MDTRGAPLADAAPAPLLSPLRSTRALPAIRTRSIAAVRSLPPFPLEQRVTLSFDVDRPLAPPPPCLRVAEPARGPRIAMDVLAGGGAAGAPETLAEVVLAAEKQQAAIRAGYNERRGEVRAP